MSLTWSNRRTLWLLLIAFAVAGAALFLLLPIRAKNLTTGDAGWAVRGCFAHNSVYWTTHFDEKISAHERQGVVLWGSHCGDDKSTGELRSAVFTAPKVLEVFVSGWVGKASLPLFLEREDNQQRLPLDVRQPPGEIWQKLRWWLPGDMSGQRVRLVAIDNDTGWGGWLGLSNPRSFSVLNFARLQIKSAVRTIGTYVFQLALFLLPGFAAASLLTARSRRTVAPIYLVMIVIVTGGVFGYLAFWEFFFWHKLGVGLSFAVYLGSLGVLVFPKATPREAIRKTAAVVKEPFLYAALAGLCYTSFYFIYSDPFTPGVGYANDRFFVQLLAGDNIIPEIFAEKVYEQKPIRPFCCGDWLSSDRPPLQTGIVMMERPLAVLKSMELRYQLLASALQCFWICGVWCVLTALGTDRRRFRQVVGFLIFSGFLFYNSVYTWPKLLAATFILFVLSLVFTVIREKRTLTYFETVLAAVCLGLMLMAHPGSTFSLPVLAIMAVYFRRLFPWRRVALAVAIIVCFYLPWSAYQKLVDPPGNRLLKMHLGGIIDVDSRTTWEGIRDSYHTHTWKEIAAYKWSNITKLAREKTFDSYGLGDFQGGHLNHAATEETRAAQRVLMWNAVGLVNFGWLAALYLLVNQRRRKVEPAIPFAWWLIAAALLNMVSWCLVTFGPDETQTAHSSYADILLISIGLLSFILALPRIFYWLLLAWQVFNLFVVWVWSAPARIAQPITLQWPMIVLGICLTAVVLWLTVRAEVTAESLPDSYRS